MSIGSTNVGGVGLNFKVKAYPSLESLPATAPENTIAIITDTAITDWAMSYSRPAGKEGLVWLNLAAQSNVSLQAVKRRNFTVSPGLIQQYVSGTWASKDWRIWQGEWKQGITFLLLAGKENLPLYGGFTVDKVVKTFTANSMRLIFTNAYGKARTAQRVPCTGFSAIRINVSEVSNYSGDLRIDLETNITSRKLQNKIGEQLVSLDGADWLNLEITGNHNNDLFVFRDTENRPAIELVK